MEEHGTYLNIQVLDQILTCTHFSYKFNPWTNENTISDGKTILKYLNETSSKFDLDKKIKYNHWLTKFVGTQQKTNGQLLELIDIKKQKHKI